MSKDKLPSWEEIPYDKNASAADKAAEFEAQWNSNGGNEDRSDESNPYSKENFKG